MLRRLCINKGNPCGLSKSNWLILYIADGTFSYESEDFDPIPLDLYTAASLGEVEIIQDILDK